MNRKILVAGSALGLISIVLGAFASHGLGNLVSEDSIETFQVGVRYQMYHALLLLFIGSVSNLKTKSKKWIFYFTVIGILLFSGSIYGLATDEMTGFSFKSVGFITPIGGFLLIVSWTIMLIDFLKQKE